MLNHNSIADETTPLEFNLSQNYPNPFKEKTTIKYCVPYKTRVQLNVYDSNNKLIEKLVDEVKDPGTYEVKFSASVCNSGEARNLQDGYYYFRLKTPDYLSEKKWFCINHLFGRLNMKNLLHTLFFFLLTTQICFAQWYQQHSGTTQNINKVQFIDTNTGWAVGDSGTILHTTNGGVSFIDDETIQPTEFVLEQNFPNPFNPSTVISYQLPVSGNVTLKIYDLLGNEITKLVNEYKPAGRMKLSLTP